MHHVRTRFVEIVSHVLTAYLMLAVLAASSTVVRNAVVHPSPTVVSFSVKASEPENHRKMYRLPRDFSSSLYYVGTNSSSGESIWEPNARLYVPSSAAAAAGPRDPAAEVIYLIRQVDYVELKVSGNIHFSPCWDWNTKAIFVSFVASYQTAGATVNEVTFADMLLRPPPLPTSIPAPVRALLRSSAEWTHEDEVLYDEYLRSLRTSHDVPSVRIDPHEKSIVLEDVMKYPVEDYQSGSLIGRSITIRMRYQVMSYSGWAPVVDKELGAIRFNVQTEVFTDVVEDVDERIGPYLENDVLGDADDGTEEVA